MKNSRAFVCTVVAIVFAVTANAEIQKANFPKKVGSAALPNAFQLTDKVFSGGQPDGEAAFKELKDMGIKTVITVDGAKPDVKLAKKFGLRYVHLPHGYDGIPATRLLEFTKAVEELPGPIYIHCHHGKHRSPAAAAAACIAAGYLTTDQGMAVLKAAGTSKDYRGLFQAVQDARPIDKETIDAARIDFHETTKIPPLADAMGEIDHTFDNLKGLAANGWKATEKHADIDPPHEALLLREHFTELLRTDDVKNKSPEFVAMLKANETGAQRLEDALRAGNANITSINQLFERVTANCTSCHKKLRDVPLSEKTIKN